MDLRSDFVSIIISQLHFLLTLSAFLIKMNTVTKHIQVDSVSCWMVIVKKVSDFNANPGPVRLSYELTPG